MGKAGAYTHLNALFNADNERVIGDLTAVGAYHGRTDVHPLFVLLLNPPGVAVSKLSASPLVTAVAMNSLVGALCVVGAMAFFRRARLGLVLAGIFAAILGFSSTHLVFGSTPETWIFAAAGMILLFLLALYRGGRFLYFVPTGVFATGMVTTNFAHALIAFAAGIAKRASSWGVVWRSAALAASVAAATVVLSIAQKLIYPGTTAFFLPDVYRRELGSYAHVATGLAGVTWDAALSRVAKLVTHLFIYNVVAPGAVVRWFSAGEYCLPMKPFVDLDPATLGPLGWTSAVLWATLVLGGVYAAVRNRDVRRPIFYGLWASILFNFVFFFFYGSAIFIYSVSSTFPLVAAAALALRPYERPGSVRYRGICAFLLVFLAVEIINNLSLLYRALYAFRSYPFPLSP